MVSFLPSWPTFPTNHAHDDDDSYISVRSSWPLAVAMLLLGIILGQTSNSSNSSRHEDGSGGSVFFVQQCLSRTIMHVLENYLVPVYTLVVLLYLTALAFRPHLVDYYCWRRVLASPHESIRKAKRQEAVPITTAATMPLEEEFAAEDEREQEKQPIDMSGAFKLVSNDNFEGFLAVQGVPWALRRAANQARPVHRITHVGCHLTIKIEGIIESQTSYVINGPPVETNVRGRIFRDAVSYLTTKDVLQNGASSSTEPVTNGEDENANRNSSNENRTSSSSDSSDHHHDAAIAVVGMKVHKEAIEENYTITVQRQLSPNQQEITMTSTAFFRDGRDPVRCIQQFRRVE